MKQLKVTYAQFIKFNPCYSEEKIQAIIGRKKTWTALDVLALKDVPAKDRLWSVLRIEFIDAPILHEFACCCAEEALKQIANPDPRSLKAIEVKRKWVKGEATEEELARAARAAYAVADAAAADAAAAAYAAAYAAADAADAADAAAYAAYAAADAAADAAAADVAYEMQIKLLIDLLEVD